MRHAGDSTPTRGEPKLIRRRMRFENNFTQLPNVWLRDSSLSFRARGLLALLMSHDDGWMITLKGLAQETTEGVDAVRSACNELEQQGYLKRHAVKGRGGKFEGHDWEICDPHDLGAATLFTALDNPTRSRTALDYPTRTALDNPTPIRTPSRTYKESSKGNHRAHLSESGRRCDAELVDDRHCLYGHIIEPEPVNA